MRIGNKWLRTLVAVAVATAWSGLVGPGALAASSNLIYNPSGAGGSTAGWYASYSGNAGNPVLSAVTRGGAPWLQYAATLTENGGVWVQYNLPTYLMQQGATYTCGFEAEGSGAIYADVWSGSKTYTSGAPQALSGTPQTFTVTFPLGNPANSVNFEVRYNTAPATVLFNEATCMPGSSVTLTNSPAGVPTPANLVYNPDGSQGTAGWYGSYGGTAGAPALSATTIGGSPWLTFSANLRESGGVWVQYNFESYFLKQGATYSCAFKAEGSGALYADVWNGDNSYTSGPPQTLSATTPTVLKLTFPMGNPDNTPNFEVRYNLPPVAVDFTDVTCVPGSTVSLASTSPAATPTPAAAPAAATTTLPRTGLPIEVPAAGILLVLVGLALAVTVRRPARR